MLFTFDPPETGWTLGSSNSLIVDDPTGPTPPNALRLGYEGSAERTLSSLVVGEHYPIYLWCNWDEVDDGTTNTIRILYNNQLQCQFYKAEGATGWELRHVGTLNYYVAGKVLKIQSTFWQSGNVHLDSIFIGEDVAKRSRWLAHQRLVAVLRGINGAGGGYHLDLGSRAFTKYIRPVGSTHPALPYICVPLVNSNPRVEHDGTWIKHTWTLPIMAFVAEPNVGAFDSDAIAVLYHLGEDVYRAVMQDPTLQNTVDPVSFISGGIDEAGISPFDGMPYADAVIPIDLSIRLGLDVLGP